MAKTLCSSSIPAQGTRSHMPQLSLREECRSYMLQLRPHTAKQINNFFKDIKKKKIHSSLIAELTISVAV